MTIELIEQKVKQMNADDFHRMGDHFLYFDGGSEYDSINPIGQAEGKQKSRGGTPDTKIRLTNGKYILIQYTTQSNEAKKKFYNKLLEDMRSCFDIEKTKISIDKIERVVLCFNSNLDSVTENLLAEEANGYGVELKLVNLSTVSHRIYKYYPNLAKEYLGVEVDTYQLITIPKFIDEYEKGGFATPLSNPIKHRTKELEEISKSIDQHLITVISGKSGVGKSRLVVEAVTDFQKANTNYVGICIKNKDLPVIYDLRKVLQSAKEYLLFIDDANKSIAHLKEVISFYQESSISFKLIVTVRDYAVNEIKALLNDYSANIITIDKLDDDHIKEIIQVEPFNIRNPLFQDRVIQVAKGNPRLAIMTSVACKDKSLNDLANTADIYHHYFQRNASDTNVVFTPTNLRVLGILSFFRIIERDAPDTLKILKAFGIKVNHFWTVIYDLNRVEVVDVYNDSSIKFSDQILESYVFYRSFFVDKLLDYQLLLDQFFDAYESRIKYTAIDANNMFGYRDFGDLIKPYIQDKYQSIAKCNGDLLKFLRIFWIYLQEETLLYAKRQIDLLPIVPDLELTGEVINGQHNTKAFRIVPDILLSEDHFDELFRLLSEYLQHEIDDLDLACDLIFAYLEKKQELADTLVKFCIANFSFTYRDEAFRYYRVVQFTDSLIAKIDTRRPVYMYVFLRLVPHFLQTTYDSTVIKGSRFTMSKSQPEADEVVLGIRQKYWDCFSTHFTSHPALSIYTLNCIYNTFFPDFHAEMRMADWPHLVKIFDHHFDTSIFRDAYIMNQFADAMLKGGLEDESVIEVKNRAMTDEYENFLILDWSRIRRRERRDGATENWEEYENRFDKLKLMEIQRKFRLACADDYIQVFECIAEFIKVDLWENFNAYRPSQLLLDNAESSQEIYLALLKYLLSQSLVMRFINSTRVVNRVQNNIPHLLSEVEQLFNSGNHPNKDQILVNFYDTLYGKNITPVRSQKYLDVLGKVNGKIDLKFYNSQDYCETDGNFLFTAITILLSRADSGEVNFTLGYDFIERNFKLLNSAEKLCQDLYLYLISGDNGDDYDYEGSELLFLLRLDQRFFDHYLDHLFKRKKYKLNEHHQIGVVWKLADYQTILTMAIDKFYALEYLSYSTESLLGDLLANTPDVDDFEQKWFLLFKNTIERDHASIKKIKWLFKIIIPYAGNRLAELTKIFLSLNHDIDCFKQINWISRGTYLMSGNAISAEIDIKRWNLIKSIVDIMKPKIEYLQHREFINQQINHSQKWAQSERKRMFIRDDND